MSDSEFFSHSMAHDAVIRQLEIIGEAARHVSDQFQETHSNIPWIK